MEDSEELVGSIDSEDWEDLYNKSPYIMGCSTDEDDADFENYNAQIEATEGFEVRLFPPIMPGMIIPSACNEEGVIYSKVALHHYNQSKDANFEFVKLEKRNVQVVKGFLSYLTFTAQSAESVQTFQAKVWTDIDGPNGELPLEVYLCRIKPTTPTESDEDSRSNSPPEKRQKMERAAEIEGKKQVDSEQMTDVSFLDLHHEFFGKDVHTNDEYYKNYCTQVMHSQGFDVSNFPIMFAGQIMPLDTSERSLNLVRVFAELALSHYVILERMTSETVILEFLRIEKSNVQTESLELVSMPFKAKNANFYITFKVKMKYVNKKDDGSTQTLQTLIWSRDVEEGQLQIKVMFVRNLIPTCEGN